MGRSHRRTHQNIALGHQFGEPLEARLALSGPDNSFDFWPETATLAIVHVAPADGATLASAPVQITMTFDRPLDEYSLGGSDLLLERLDSQGEVEWVLDTFFNPVVESLDASGTELRFDLPTSVILEAGHYRISLSDSAFLMGLDGELLPEIGVAQVVGSFTLAPHGVGLADAIDLGTIGPDVRMVSGHLDFQADPTAVALYRFHVPDGGAFRFGAEVVAQRMGSALDAALAVFDAQGNVIRVADLGLSDAPLDPFLFLGLESGTYYLGVSGVGNLPGSAGGYDPQVGLPELNPRDRSSGAFQLYLVADPILEPTRLISFNLETLDDLDTSPTGFSLQFSGVVATQISEADEAGLFPGGIELVDARGRLWPIVPNGLGIGSARVNYALVQRLPAGTYTVRLAQAGTLLDLAGNPPIAEGQPIGVLATLTVLQRRSAHDSDDLGSSFPQSLEQGISRDVSLASGESIAYRAVNLREQFLRFRVTTTGGPVHVEVLHTGTGQQWTFELDGDTDDLADLLRPAAGALLIRFAATGNESATIHWSLAQNEIHQERIVLNGVGQGPALNLRLIHVDSGIPDGSDNGGGSSESPWETPNTTPAPRQEGPFQPAPPVGGGYGPTNPFGGGELNPSAPPPVTPLPSVPSPFDASSGIKPQSAMILGFGGQLVGRPFEIGQGQGGEGALALSSVDASGSNPAATSPNQGEVSVDRFVVRAGSEAEAPGTSLGEPAPGTDGATESRAMRAHVADAALVANPDDLIAIEAAPPGPFDAWLNRLASLAGRVGLPNDLIPGIEPDESPFEASPDSTSAESSESPRIIRADLSTTTGVALTAAALLEGRRLLIRWLGSRRGLQRAGRSRTSRTTTRRRESCRLGHSMAHLN